MAVKRITYLDLSPEQRRKGAEQARLRLRGVLANPFLPAEQVRQVHQQLEHLDQWEKGQLQLPQDEGK